jgi:predicted ATPase
VASPSTLFYINIYYAAARVRHLATRQIAAHLDDRFRLLTTGSRSAPTRQQTIRATIDWSYQLLSEAEHLLFDRCSVFSGGWTLDAAEAIAAGDGIDTGDVLDLLGRLVDKSLVVAELASSEAPGPKPPQIALSHEERDGLERLVLPRST